MKNVDADLYLLTGKDVHRIFVAGKYDIKPYTHLCVLYAVLGWQGLENTHITNLFSITPNSYFIACSAKMKLGPLHIFPLPADRYVTISSVEDANEQVPLILQTLWWFFSRMPSLRQLLVNDFSPGH